MADRPMSKARYGRPLPRQSQVFFFLILGFMLFMTWRVFQNFFIFIVTGLFVAVLALPIDKMWERFVPNRLAAFFTMTSLFLLITVPLILLGFAMYKDVTQMAEDVQSGKVEELVLGAAEKPWAQDLLQYAYPEQNGTALNDTVRAQVHRAQTWLQEQLERLGGEMVQAVPNFMIGITIVMFVVYYVLVDGERFVAYVRRAAPLPGRQIDFLMREARNGLSAVFIGQILTSLLQGVLGGIGFVIAGIPNPVMWGAVMAILALLPVVGTNLVWIPAAIYLFITDQVAMAIFMLIWGTFVVMIFVDNLVRPRLIGTRADIHPMFVLVGVLGGAAVFGFVGLFLGPLIVGVTIAVLKVYEADYLDPNVNLVDEYVSHHEADPYSSVVVAADEAEPAPPKVDEPDPPKGGPT